jgi:anti-sigma B factor antagonist
MSQFSVEKRQDAGVVVLRGSFEGGWDVFHLKDQITENLKGGRRRFVIDMGESRFINSTGIGVLIAVQANIKKADGELKICNVSDRVRRSLFVTGADLWRSFDIHADRDEALQAFGIWSRSGSSKKP